VAERLDYASEQDEPKRRPFWPRGLDPIDFAIIFGGMMVSTLSDDYLRAHGWSWWQQAIVLMVLLGGALSVRRAFGSDR